MIDGALAIDAHCHIGEFKKERHGLLRFTAEDLLALMAPQGIDVSVISYLPSGLHEREEYAPGNDVVIDAVNRHPGKLVGLAVINPRLGHFAEQELVRCLRAGLRGVKLNPSLHGPYPVGGETLDPIMGIASEAEVPVFVHSDANSKNCSPNEVARLAARWPQVPVVMLHMGMDAEWLVNVPEVAAQTPNLLLETSNTPDYPHAVYVNSARRIGSERVIFGSDGPVVSLEVNLTKLRVAEERYGLTGVEKRRILGENAARLLKLAFHD
jgi:predicted TIM-barrel fold metal-dependent hydrolase